MPASEERDPESFRLLGRSETRLPAAPEAAILDAFENRHASRDYWIRLEVPEFSSLCPVTGQPDFAHITIRYVPDRLCVETKSLKFYLAAFRNHAAFNEDVVNRIFDDLMRTCAPRRLHVRGAFSARGGISLTVEASHPED